MNLNIKKHKVNWGPGYTFYICDEGCACGHEWKEKSRHCESPSSSICPECNETVYPDRNEKHYEWETDESGNIKDGNK